MLPQVPPHQRADYDAGKRHHYPHKRVVDQIAQLHNNDTTYKTIYTTLAP
jgi:valyl-tRNA synthetase